MVERGGKIPSGKDRLDEIHREIYDITTVRETGAE